MSRETSNMSEIRNNDITKTNFNYSENMIDNKAIILYTVDDYRVNKVFFKIEYINNMYIKYQSNSVSIVDIDEVLETLRVLEVAMYCNKTNSLFLDSDEQYSSAAAVYECHIHEYGIVDINIHLLPNKELAVLARKILLYDAIKVVTGSLPIYRYYFDRNKHE